MQYLVVVCFIEPHQTTVLQLHSFFDDLHITSSVTSSRGFQILNVPTFDSAQAETIYRSVKRTGNFE